VEVVDEQAVPAKYRRASFTVPEDVWELVKDSLALELRSQ
jgi:hypothetical protein